MYLRGMIDNPLPSSPLAEGTCDCAVFNNFGIHASIERAKVGVLATSERTTREFVLYGRHDGLSIVDVTDGR